MDLTYVERAVNMKGLIADQLFNTVYPRQFSFVLDCPLYLKKISIQDAQVVEVSKNQISPVAYLRLKQLTLVNK